jgi:hypothetical protein
MGFKKFPCFIAEIMTPVGCFLFRLSHLFLFTMPVNLVTTLSTPRRAERPVAARPHRFGSREDLFPPRGP